MTGGRGGGHSRVDHLFGALVDHVHAPGEDHDHDHDHDAMDGLLVPGEDGGATLLSIGIDVGSSGTQLVVTRLRLEAPRGDGAARLSTTQRETIYRSPVFLTPYADADRIDEQRLGAIVDRALGEAAVSPDDIDCGVVILTGAAAARANAAQITARLAETCGDLVSAAAGDHLEARLAAWGSGAVERSAEFAQRLLNIDIGGATTKLAVCDGGRIAETAALEIGGRLVAVDPQGRIERLDLDGVNYAGRCGISWEIGGSASWAERRAVAARMADDLMALLSGRADTETSTTLLVTDHMPNLAGVTGVMISGGVGEYVAGRETASFGDLGLALGRALVQRIDRGALPWPLLPAGECIRATALGASAYSVQLSGRTGFISDAGRLLPRRNLPVVSPDVSIADVIDSAALAAAIRVALTRQAPQGDVVLSLTWQGDPEHARLAALAAGIRDGLSDRTAAGLPAYVILDGDIAGSLGAVLRDEMGFDGPLLVLDGIALADLDYVDLGRVRLPSETVPVTVKSLVFPSEREQNHPPRRRGPRPGPGGEGER